MGVSILILLTACTNTNPTRTVTNNSSTVVNSSNDNKGTVTQFQEANEFNLPTMGIESQKKENKKTIEYDTGQDIYEQKIANPRTAKTKDVQDLQSMGFGLINSTTSEEVKKWFNSHKITSEVSVGASDDGVRNLSFDLLMPLYEQDNNLFFTQAGFRRSNRYTEDYRNTLNVGVGYRHMYEKALLGLNTFYDTDITGHNNRLGLGVEAWADYLKLAANSYIRLTNWKKSVDMYDYMERPANGWDLRADAYLPQYPQLGGKLMYEQYYGDNVGLFGSSTKQKDPSATTIGLNYTPIPLITLSSDYRTGQDNQSDLTVSLALNLQIGVPLKKQLSPDEIRSSRLLSNAKYDLVNRNNEIVMDYRKNELGTLTLPNTLSASPNSTLSIPVIFTGRISNVTWTGSAAQYAIPYGGGATASVQIPAYNPRGINVYDLQAIGNDEFGHLVKSNITQITVTANQLTMLASQPTTIANGTDFIVFTANLKQYSGVAVQNTDVVWTIQGNATVMEQENKTDSNGIARLKISSKFANLVKVSVKEVGGTDISNDVVFTADSGTAKVTSVTSTLSSLVADGVSFSTITAIIQDENGNTVPVNTPITWSTTSGQLSSLTSLTDVNGQTTVTFKTTLAGNATITASAAKGNGTVSITATPNTSTARVISINSSAPSVVANNTTSSVISVTVHDVNGNPVPANTPIGWSTTFGTLSSNLTYTDTNGVATASILSSTVGNAIITATAAQGAMSTPVTFTVDLATLTPINLTPNPTTALADGIDVVSLSVTVQDAFGNKAPANTPVTWSTNIGTLTAASSLTDSNGLATMTMKSNVAGNATVIVISGVGSTNTSISFTSSSTASVNSINALTSTMVANNTPVTIQATVLDNNNQPVQNATVNWSTTLGNLSSATSTTNASGLALITITSTVAGNAVISASSDGGGALNTNVQFNADLATANIYSTSASSLNIIPDGNTPVTLYAQISDVNGNPLGAGIIVNWSVSSDAAFDFDYTQNVSSMTNAAGIAEIPLFAWDVGQHIVTADYNGSSSNISLTAAPVPVTITGIIGNPVTNVNASTSIIINTDTDMGPNGYTAYITCISLCQDINGNDIFPSEGIPVSLTRQIRLPNFIMGQTGTLKFSVRVNNGVPVEVEIEVYPEES